MVKAVVRFHTSLVGRLAKDKVGVFVDEHMRPKIPQRKNPESYIIEEWMRLAYRIAGLAHQLTRDLA